MPSLLEMPTPTPRRIVLTTAGSLGDLHPYIALALGLRARGHTPLLATSPCYRHKIESLGLPFHPIRPDSAFTTDPASMARIMHPRWGTLRVGRDIFLPAVRQTYADLSSAAAGLRRAQSSRADLIVSHPLITPAARLVSEVSGIPWASTAITPLCFLSPHDLPVIPLAPGLCKALRPLGPAINRPLVWAMKRASRPLAREWYRLRADLGLPPTHEPNALVDSHARQLELALFSQHFAAPQPDWPPQARCTGFPIYDHDAAGASALPPALADFLDAGPPPIVFTLACSASARLSSPKSAVAGDFFAQSAAAAAILGRRAVLIVGKDPKSTPAALPPDVVAFAYAPFSQLFPRAAAIVHAAGIGTTAHVLRAGRPSIAVPHAHDQPDNAARLTRLGLARTLLPHSYTASRITTELHHLLEDPAYARRAAEIGQQVRQEDGTRAACDAIEQLLQSTRPTLPSLQPQ
jgi:UDP:flavonoid glycosyltransferase YjiC (YdhE family)